MSPESSLVLEPFEKKGIQRKKGLRQVSHYESLGYIYIICIIIGRLLLLMRYLNLALLRLHEKNLI